MISNFLVKIACFIIKFYQQVIGPFLMPRCRFFPSCSEYSWQSFTRFGFALGIFLTIKRLLKCQPFHRGGFDPVPSGKK
jgi:uncharacterized protein